MFPDVPVIDRPGIVSAWDDLKFVAAIEKTGRKNLIMAGVTIDVVYDGDASGALEVTIRENAVARMKDHGITPINWTTVGAELQRNWSLPNCSKRSTAPDLAAANPAPTGEPVKHH